MSLLPKIMFALSSNGTFWPDVPFRYLLSQVTTSFDTLVCFIASTSRWILKPNPRSRVPWHLAIPSRSKLILCILRARCAVDQIGDLCARIRHQGQAGTSNYIPQHLQDVITCPWPWYLLLAYKSSNDQMKFYVKQTLQSAFECRQLILLTVKQYIFVMT